MKRMFIITAVIAMAAALFVGLAPDSHADDGAIAQQATTQTRGLAALLQELDLSEAQTSQIATILKADRETIQAQVDAVREARSELAEAIHAESFDEQAIRDASAAVADAQTELAVTRGRLVQSVREVLTPEQRATLESRRTEAKAQMEGRIGLVRSLVNGWIDRHAG